MSPCNKVLNDPPFSTFKMSERKVISIILWNSTIKCFTYMESKCNLFQVLATTTDCEFEMTSNEQEGWLLNILATA